MNIGIALGSGSARGWSHIGVIEELLENGIEPNVVCGTSIGALVGAAYAAGNLAALKAWVLSLSKLELASFFSIDLSLKNGFVNDEKLREHLARYVAPEALEIHDLPSRYGRHYGAVATELYTGAERWLKKGSVLDAVWASIALPALFAPVKYQGKWLVDGGLVNPVPVSLCRALEADVVIAVNLNGDLLQRNAARGKKHGGAETASVRKGTERKEREQGAEQLPSQGNVAGGFGLVERMSHAVKDFLPSRSGENASSGSTEMPSLFESVAGSMYIVQDKITRSRLAGDPPDFIISPKLPDIGLLEFYRAAECIEEGRKCVRRIIPELQEMVG